MRPIKLFKKSKKKISDINYEPVEILGGCFSTGEQRLSPNKQRRMIIRSIYKKGVVFEGVFTGSSTQNEIKKFSEEVIEQVLHYKRINAKRRPDFPETEKNEDHDKVHLSCAIIENIATDNELSDEIKTRYANKPIFSQTYIFGFKFKSSNENHHLMHVFDIQCNHSLKDPLYAISMMGNLMRRYV